MHFQLGCQVALADITTSLDTPTARARPGPPSRRSWGEHYIENPMEFNTLGQFADGPVSPAGSASSRNPASIRIHPCLKAFSSPSRRQEHAQAAMPG